MLLLIIAGTALGGGNKSDENKPATAATQAAPKAEAPAEPPIVISANQLDDELKANALKAANSYKGKTVEITGLVGTIDSSGKYFTVKRTDGEFSMTNIQLYIKPDMKDKLASLSKDQSVTVVGKVKDVGEILGYSIDVSSIK